MHPWAQRQDNERIDAQGERRARSTSAESELSDLELIGRLTGTARVDGAIAELFRRHLAAARRAAASVAGCRTADDVASEVFAAMVLAVQRGRGPVDGGVRAYLCGSARRLARRHRDRELPGSDHTAHLVAADQVERAVLDWVVDVDVFPGWTELPSRSRQILWWSAVCGLSAREIGDRTGLRPNTVTVIGARARTQLRQQRPFPDRAAS